jgi:RsiW-degrading membrane proteinase PrsW (M82 family)
MKGLLLYVGFVIAWTAAGVLIASYIDRVTSHQIGSIVLLAMFFSGLVVSWIATVFVMDGRLITFSPSESSSKPRGLVSFT